MSERGSLFEEKRMLDIAARAAWRAVGAQFKLVSLLVTRGGTLETGTYACRQQYNQRDTVIEFNSVTQYHCAADVMAIWRIALRGSRS